MRLNLDVPPIENREAKAAGAWWDPTARTWYVDKVPSLAPFQRWLRKGAHLLRPPELTDEQAAHMREITKGTP